jgi:hypothetical protein
MPASLLPWIKPQFCDAEGVPVAGGQLYSFVAGTDTPQPTYSDSDLLIPNSNPIVLNAGGWSNTSIYLLPTGYKFRLDTADDVPLWTVDYILGTGTGESDAGAWHDIAFNSADFTADGGGSVALTVLTNRWRQMDDQTVLWSFYASPVNYTGPSSARLLIQNLPFQLMNPFQKVSVNSHIGHTMIGGVSGTPTTAQITGHGPWEVYTGGYLAFSGVFEATVL